MKKVILLSLSLILTLSVFAQTEEKTVESPVAESASWNEMETMETFAKRKGTHGFYIGVGGGYAGVGNIDFANVEAKFAYVNDQKFEIGFGGQTFQSFESIAAAGEQNQFVGGALGGMYLKAIFFGRKKMHVSIPLFLGVGAAAVYEQDQTDIFDCFDPEVISSSPFLVAEPGVNLEFNISKMLGFEMGAKYRISSQTDFLGNGISDLNGLVISGMLKVGLFDFGGKRNKIRMD